MAGIGKTVLTLRVLGDDLDPSEVTALLGAEPTACARKGEVRISKSGQEVAARTGSWRLKVADREPGDLNGQLEDLFSRLTQDLSVWKDLSKQFRCDVFCGLFMKETNEGEELTPSVLAALGARGLKLGMDIYTPD